MMKYFKNPSNSEVFGFDEDEQSHLIADKIAENWEDVTDSWPPAPVIIQIYVVTMRQARLALLAAGKLDDVDAAILAIKDATARKAAQIEWEFSNDVRKDSPLIQQLAPSLGLDSAALTELFNTAATL